jgi:hypothetical protein
MFEVAFYFILVCVSSPPGLRGSFRSIFFLLLKAIYFLSAGGKHVHLLDCSTMYFRRGFAGFDIHRSFPMPTSRASLEPLRLASARNAIRNRAGAT